MSDDKKDFGICKYCEDERGLCDGIFLDDVRRFICFNLYFFTILLAYPLPCKSFCIG